MRASGRAVICYKEQLIIRRRLMSVEISFTFVVILWIFIRLQVIVWSRRGIRALKEFKPAFNIAPGGKRAGA